MIRAELFEDGYQEGYREAVVDLCSDAERGKGPAAAAAYAWAADKASGLTRAALYRLAEDAEK